MKRGRRKTSFQALIKNKVFATVRPWIVYYTEQYADAQEKDFFTFIKAKSRSLAMQILVDKTKEDDSTIKVKAVRGYLLHKDYQNSRTNEKLNIESWAKVNESSFPNTSNFLFKKEIPRPEGYTNRFNKTDVERLKKIGFKKGEDNWSRKHRKGTHLPLEQRKGKKWTGGSWVKIDDEEIKMIESKLIGALIIHDNNRTFAAQHLNISRGKFYKLMKIVHDLDWWNENYPTPKFAPPILPTKRRSALQKETMKKMMDNGHKPFDLTEAQATKRDNNKKTAIKKSSVSYRKSLIPIIKQALVSSNNNRTHAAKNINVNYSTFKRWLRITKEYVDWATEFPVK